MGKVSLFMSIALVSFCCMCITNNAFATQRDSLLLLIEQTVDDKKKVDLYNTLSSIHRDTAFTKSQKYSDTAYQLAVSNNYPLGEAQSLYNKARSLAIHNQPRKALPFLEEAVSIVEQLPNAKANHANFLVLQGWINNRLSKFHTAILLYEKAYAINDSLKNDNGRATTLLNIGTIHNQVGDKEIALDYYKKANKINKQLNNKHGLAYSLMCIGYIHEEKEKYETALTYYQEALELAEELNSLRRKSNILANMGVSYLKLGQLDQSLNTFKKTREIDLKLQDERSVGYCDLYIAKIEFLQSKTNKITVLENAYQTGVQYDDIELQRLSAENLSEMFTSLGFFQKALQQKILATQLQDSMKNQDIKLKIKSIEVQKQFENTQKQIAQEKKEALLESSLAYQTKTKNILLLFLSILLLVGFLLYRAYKTTLAVKKKLLIKNESLKKTEERLALNNKDLQKHINLNVELEQFAYIASHDIKAPLRTIASFTSILKNKFYDQAEERDKTCFDFVEKSAKSLNLLVDDLLEFSKSNSQSLKVERLAFKEIINDVSQNLDFSITQVNGTILLNNCDFFINADQIKLKQILQNIVSNALKFKDAERAPIITISAREEEAHFFISIKDNGIGIAQEHFQEVFEKFARLNSQSKFEGSGLGLSICAKYIKKHQGKIWIERNEDVGVTFTFTIKKDLPLSKVAAKANELVQAIPKNNPLNKKEIVSLQ